MAGRHAMDGAPTRRYPWRRARVLTRKRVLLTRIYLKCAKLLDVSPSECLVIEDSANGILAGKNAGMRVCAFTGTRHHDFDLSKADFEIASFSPNDLAKIEQILIKTEMKNDGARPALSDGDAGNLKNKTGDEPE